jgi:hypothetical protein
MPARPLAIVAAGLLALALAGPGLAEKPREPKPRLELLTESQEAVLRNEAVKVRVESKRGRRARVEARLTVDGFPDDFNFRLGPESGRLRRDEAKLKLPLSARQEEVLAFAEQACDGARLELEVRAGRARTTLGAPLQPKRCRLAARGP